MGAGPCFSSKSTKLESLLSQIAKLAIETAQTGYTEKIKLHKYLAGEEEQKILHIFMEGNYKCSSVLQDFA